MTRRLPFGIILFIAALTAGGVRAQTPAPSPNPSPVATPGVVNYWSLPPGWSGTTKPVGTPEPIINVTRVSKETGQAMAMKRYLIQEDDTLWDLAQSFYGKPWLWPLFLKFNSISNPDLIHPGDALLFPNTDVLISIKEKSPEQVKEIRETMEKQATPVLVKEPPAAPVTAKAEKPVTETAAKATPASTPSPTPAKTPTFKITGSKTINISYAEAVGGSGNGLTNTGYDRHETLRLQMEGQLNDEVKILGHFAQSDLALEDDYDLTLTTKHWEFFFGNFSPSLTGSQYLSSSLSSTGIRATGKYDDWDVTAFYATPQGRPLYQKFFGNNTQGPYTVPGVPLAPGSEIIWLNKQKLTRGVDYTLDYTLGNLIFLNRIIQLTDLIEVQAVSSGAVFNTQIYGYRAELALMGKVNPSAPGALPRTSPSSAGVTGLGTGAIPGFASAGVTGLAAPLPEAAGNTGSARTAGVSQAGNAAKGPSWTVGQGYLRQFEQPDANVTTATGRVAADTHMLELDSTLDLGPALKLSGEADGSAYLSSDTNQVPSKEGVAYRAQGDTYQGPFHFQGKVSGTSPNFISVGNPLTSNNFFEWSALGDFKEGDSLFAQADRSFQRNFTTGFADETTTDHGEAKAKPKGWPEADYVYYHSAETRQDPSNPFTQEDLKNTASLSFGLAGLLGVKLSGLQESQTGTNLGENHSYGGRAEISSQKWKDFNFSVSGEWKLTDIIESGSNTMVPQAAPGSNVPSQTYTYTMEGKPFNHLTLSGKGTYSDAPPGPAKANVTQSFHTDPFPGFNANGSYSLDFQQIQVLGNNSPEQVHTASGGADWTPFKWIKLSAQPSCRFDVLPDYGGNALSDNFHQNYRASFTPSFGSLNADYTLDHSRTWDGSTAGFPLNFKQSSETINLSAKKPLGKVNMDASYKRSDQTQESITTVSDNLTHTLNQSENDSIAWSADAVLTFTLSHAYNQLNQDSPGQGILDNPLLPNGSDTFNSNFTQNAQNAFTYSHTFTGRVTEQLLKTLSIYEEGGYTHTVDVLKGGTVETYSPAAGFTWKPGSFLNWTGSYQYNGSSGEVSTTIQKAQTTLSATLNPAASLAVNWSWSRADNPFVQNQQGNVAYTMNF